MKLIGYKIETIDPSTGKARALPVCSRVAIEDDLAAFYEAIGCDWVEIITRRAEALGLRPVAIVLDDEGQLKPSPVSSGFTVSLRDGKIKEELVGNLLIFANDPSNEESGLGSLSESDIQALDESTHPAKGVIKLPLFAI